MENFFTIRAEKQEHIINAAFTVFGKQGYKKASVADIAAKAGITKGMITYYFGSKKNLYLYLCEVAQRMLKEQVHEQLTPDITDFFEKIKIIANIQVNAIKAHPALSRFVDSVYEETDPGVVDDVETIFKSEVNRFDKLLMEELLEKPDFTKFKPGIDAKLLCRFIVWAIDGCSSELFESLSKKDRHDIEEIEEMLANLCACLDLMQKTFYK